MKRGDPNGLAALNEATREPLLDNLYTERAQMLPYDERVEFPLDRLEFGTLLGSGEYGRVLKARARGILGGHNFSTVAVKTLKENPELEKGAFTCDIYSSIWHMGEWGVIAKAEE